MWDPVSGLAQLQALKTSADQMRLKAVVLKVSAVAEVDEALAAASRDRVDALLILSSPLLARGRTFSPTSRCATSFPR